MTGGESDEHGKMGSHTKFCTSLGLSLDGKCVYSGGGDDNLRCFRETEGVWE